MKLGFKVQDLNKNQLPANKILDFTSFNSSLFIKMAGLPLYFTEHTTAAPAALVNSEDPQQ